MDFACPKIHTQTDFPEDYCNPRRLGLINMSSLFLIGGTVPSSSEYEQDSCSLCCSLIYPTVPSSTREDTVVANAMTKNVKEQDTKTFQGVKAKCAHLALAPLILLCLE